MKLSLAAAGAGLVIALSTPAQAADVNHMLEKCRKVGAGHYHTNTGIVEVKYEGQRTDKTHAVNGTVGLMHFQCSFRADGKRITHTFFESPEGCPADVSQADRYKYPDCD